MIVEVFYTGLLIIIESNLGTNSSFIHCILYISY